MRNSILMTVLALPLLAGTTWAISCPLFEAPESYGISSEDSGGGSYLGVDTRDITPDRLGPLHLKDERGVEVTMVDQDAPAGKAGLQEHDVILTLNGSDLQSVEQLRRMIRETPPGRVVTLGLIRNGQPLTLKVELAARWKTFTYEHNPGHFKFVMPAMPVMPTMPTMPDMDVPMSIVVVHSSVRSGLMVENLTPQLGDFFGVKKGEGVLVRSVEKGSRADKAGFRAGDVIVKINDELVHDSGDFSHALRGRKDNSASITVVRDRKEQSITITLPERKQSEIFQSYDEAPEMDADYQDEISELQSRIAELQPQMEEAVNRQLQQLKPQAEYARREAQRRAQEIKQEMRELQRELRDRHREIEMEIERGVEGADDDF